MDYGQLPITVNVTGRQGRKLDAPAMGRDTFTNDPPYPNQVVVQAN